MKLSDDRLYVWLLDLATVSASGREGLLGEQELARARRLTDARQRERFLAARVAIRSILSLHDERVAPANWKFSSGPKGKPTLANAAPGRPIHFNISHSSNRFVMVVSSLDTVGVDVEAIRARPALTQIAQRMFSPRECAQLAALGQAERLFRFYDLWTLKEAFAKALGDSVFMPLRQLDFTLSPPGQLCFDAGPGRRDAPGAWSFWLFNDDDDFRLAVAARGMTGGPGAEVEIRELEGFERHRRVRLELLYSLAGAAAG